MGTTAEKLNLVLKSKNDIKAALIERGQTVSDVFSSYADAVRAIKATVTATDDGTGNVTIVLDGVSATYSDGNVTIE